MPIMFIQRTNMMNNFPKFKAEASKLCMPAPQDSIFQHLFAPEVGPEGGIIKFRKCLFRGLIC